MKDRGLGTNKHRFRTLSDVVTCGHGCQQPTPDPPPARVCASNRESQGSDRGAVTGRRKCSGTAGNCWELLVP